MEIVKDAIVGNLINSTMSYRALVKLTKEDLEQDILSFFNDYSIGIRKDDNNEYEPGLYLIRTSDMYSITKIKTIKEYLNSDPTDNINKFAHIIYIGKDESKLISDIDSPNENNQYFDYGKNHILIGENNNKKLFLNIEKLDLLVHTTIISTKAI